MDLRTILEILCTLCILEFLLKELYQLIENPQCLLLSREICPFSVPSSRVNFSPSLGLPLYLSNILMFQQSPCVSCWTVNRHLSDTQGWWGSHPSRHKITSLPSSWLLLKFSQGISMSNKTAGLWPHTAFRLLFSSLSSNKLILSCLPRTLILETSSSYFGNPFIFKRQLPYCKQWAFPDLSAAPLLLLSTTWLLVLLCWLKGMEHNQTSAASHQHCHCSSAQSGWAQHHWSTNCSHYSLLLSWAPALSPTLPALFISIYDTVTTQWAQTINKALR